jgi:hypothetical protein
MARRLMFPGNADAAQALSDFVGEKPKRRAPSANKAREQVREMLADGNFDNAKTSHLVALYEWCHEQVYGVPPAELSQGETWKRAVFAASGMLKNQFNGDMKEVISFIQWTWRRERYREKMRREGRNDSVGRIGWRLQFVHRHLVTDYRVDKNR